MRKTKAFCFIVVVLGFTFFPALAESKGATNQGAWHHHISHFDALQEFSSQFLSI